MLIMCIMYEHMVYALYQQAIVEMVEDIKT
jgi:hypothetical protein